MNIVKYHPWSLMDDVLKSFGQDLYKGSNNNDLSNVVTGQWTPNVDVKENDKNFQVLADLPGVDPKDIEISMENNVLTIRGQRIEEKEEKEDNYSRIERFKGEFYRRFSLPETADGDNVTASSKHGVLVITIPKREQAKTRKINVDVK